MRKLPKGTEGQGVVRRLMCIPKKVGGMGPKGPADGEASDDAALDDARVEDAAFVLHPVHAEETTTSKKASRSAEDFFMMNPWTVY